MERFLVLLVLRFVVTIIELPHVEPQAIGRDCDGKSFICIDSNRYQICIDLPGGSSETLDDVVHLCPSNTYCNNDGATECDSTKPFAVGSESSNTNSNMDTFSPFGSPESISVVYVATILTPSTLIVPTLSSTVETQEDFEENTAIDLNSEETDGIADSSSTDFTEPLDPSLDSIISSLETMSAESHPETTVLSSVDSSSTEITEPLDPSPGSITSSLETMSAESQPEATTLVNDPLHSPDQPINIDYQNDNQPDINPSFGSVISSGLSPQSTVNAISSSSPESATVTVTLEKSFICVYPGRYPHESDCHKYYDCIPFLNGFVKLEVTCSFNMAFDPVLQRCVGNLNNICPPLKDTFVCISVGKFPDPSSPAKYVWCSINGSGFQKYPMTCPYGQRFNAEVEECQDWFGPDVVITSEGMQTVVIDDSDESSSDSDESDESHG